MRVRISVLGLLPVGPATVFVATFLAACGGGGGGGTTLPPLSDNDLITRSAQEGSSTTAQAVSRARAALRGIGSITPQSRGRQSGQCPRVVDVDHQGDYFDGSMLYFDEAVATLDYGNGCTDEFGDYGRGVITVRTTNVEMDLEAVLIPTALPKSTKAQASNPPSPQPSPPLTRGEGQGVGGFYTRRDW